ncbi:replicative DNA helicase, partial [candidate division WWE3 bacterium]|nr:replicative DNA helicase [candidate division WWE3 bacterium]
MSQRVPPQNIEAEQSILGALLIDKEAVIKIAQILRPEHFYRGQHQAIYAAILSLFERREPADVVTVGDELKDLNQLDKAGGETYLADLVNMVPTVANVEAYAKIVKDAYIRRSLISLANNVSSEAMDGGGGDVRELLGTVEKEVFDLSQQHMSRDFLPIRDVLAESFNRIEELHQRKSRFRGIPTGFKDIDNLLAGLQDSNLVILAARPSVGKTSLSLNIAQYVAVHEQIPVGYFSLESSKEELVDRLLASQANVDGWKIMTGNLDEQELEKITEAMAILADAPLFIDDTPGARIIDMMTKARRLQMEHGVRLLIVDYLQLAVSRNLENRVQEVTEISQ